MKVKYWPRTAAQFIVRVYRFIVSPVLGPSCRFHPTCSCYALESFERHGFFKGMFLSVCRIVKCNPWVNTKWDDPVPEEFTWRGTFGYKRLLKKEMIKANGRIVPQPNEGKKFHAE